MKRVAGDGVTHPLSWGALFSLQKKTEIKVNAVRMPNIVEGNHANSVIIYFIIYTNILFCFK